MSAMYLLGQLDKMDIDQLVQWVIQCQHPDGVPICLQLLCAVVCCGPVAAAKLPLILQEVSGAVIVTTLMFCTLSALCRRVFVVGY